MIIVIRVYIYLNLSEYLFTLFYYSFIIIYYDKYHKPSQEQLNEGIYHQICTLRHYQIVIAWCFNICVQVLGCYSIYNSISILKVQEQPPDTLFHHFHSLATGMLSLRLYIYLLISIVFAVFLGTFAFL